jgi:hypothetical protein
MVGLKEFSSCCRDAKIGEIDPYTVCKEIKNGAAFNVSSVQYSALKWSELIIQLILLILKTRK